MSKNTQFKCFVRAARDARRFEGEQDNFRRLGKQENFWSVYQPPWFLMTSS